MDLRELPEEERDDAPEEPPRPCLDYPLEQLQLGEFLEVLAEWRLWPLLE